MLFKVLEQKRITKFQNKGLRLHGLKKKLSKICEKLACC